MPRVLMRVWVCLLLCTAAVGAPPESLLQIKNAWVRWLPGELPAGGYLTLVNTGSVPVIVVGATSPDYGSVSLHQSRQRDGSMQMVPVNAVAVGPHSTLDFASMGYHLMLLQPKRALHPGEHIGLTVLLASGAPISTRLELRPPDGGAPPH